MAWLGSGADAEGCVVAGSRSRRGTAPVSGVFPADGCLHRLEIGLQAIQLSPYHAGPAAHRFQRLNTIAAFLACSCPLHLSDPGKPSDPETFLQVPPNFIGYTTKRLAAHCQRRTVSGETIRYSCRNLDRG